MAALLLTLAMSVSLLAGCAGRTAEDEGGTHPGVFVDGEPV